MMKQILFMLLPIVAFSQSFKSDHLELKVDARGRVVQIAVGRAMQDVLAADQEAVLLRGRHEGQWLLPQSAEVVANDIRLHYAGGITVGVEVSVRASHVAFELRSVSPEGAFDAVIWGPYPVTLGETVGEIVGVARGKGLAFGIQACNTKTVGGKLEFEDGGIEARGTVALPTAYGAELQAFSLDRSQPRRISVWHDWGHRFPDSEVAPIEGESVLGSRLALFGCEEEAVLDFIGQIEIAEDLPHPEINGTWIKQSPETGRSYLIGTFTESNIDTLLDAVQRAGLMSLYHDHPFSTWGHFALRKDCFPSGIEGMKAIVQKAAARKIRIGAHTLTNFITPSDAYVTPVPDARLAVTGTSELTGAVGPESTEIPVASSQYFDNEKHNWMHAARIGTELVVYRTVSKEAPYRLLDCQRGAFGTTASAHEAGSRIGKLMDHGYKVFFPNWEMQQEMVATLARFFNETGVSQMDFDGHEGCYATGQGNMAMDRFALDFYRLTDHVVVNGSSRSSHFYWHINHYLNWGEPWYEGFRESMQEYRIKNQALLERNYLPNMLGWYLLTPSTTLADMEWMLARAAGYNAGFALATRFEAFRSNAQVGVILDAIREWETARRAGAFSEDQRARLKNAKNEFHLEPSPEGWTLYPFHAAGPFVHECRMLAPGMPTASAWTWTQQAEAQPLRFIVRTEGKAGAVSDLELVIDHVHRLKIPVTLEAGMSLACDGMPLIRVYDEKGRLQETVDLSSALPELAPGIHGVSFDCKASGGTPPKVKVSFQSRGAGEAVVR